MRPSVFTAIRFVALSSLIAWAPLATAGGKVFSDAARVLESHCIECHNADTAKGGLNLVTRQGLLAGGENGPAVVQGDAHSSLLFQMVIHEESPGMPLRQPKMAPEDIAALSRWISAGTPYERPLAPPPPRRHWAFEPLAHFSSNATLDGLLLAKLKKAQLSFAPLLAPGQRVRRLSFDLLGLPPQASVVDRFVQAPTPAAWQKLVGQMLSSHHFAERWAQHWLDVARYADSDGFERDLDRRASWPYRDFVIRAMDTDMPFDRFVLWQLAGDEVAPDVPEARAATGFLAAGEFLAPTVTDTEDNKRMVRADEIHDWVSTVGSAFLGLTVGCARCHDHKFDPISTREYYQLGAAFVETHRIVVPLEAAERELELFEKRQREAFREAKMEALSVPEYDRMILRSPRMPNNPTSVRIHATWDDKLAAPDALLAAWLPPAARQQWDTLRRNAHAAELASSSTPLPRALTVMDDSARAQPAYLLRRGDARHRATEISFGFLKALGEATPQKYLPAIHPNSTGRRAALGQWLVDMDHGAGRLVARVLVNRLWQHHFGRPLVETPNDFGFQTEAPSQLDVLDFLATKLVEGGWRLKPVHRLIVQSQAYQQGVSVDPKAMTVDPRNQLWWRREPLRLEAEAVRDAILAASGGLNERLFGPAVKPRIDSDAMATRSQDAYPADVEDGPNVWRRSIYVFNKRSVRYPLLEVFDKPAATASCGRRSISTVPTQSLTLLNDAFVRARAHDLAVEATLSAETSQTHTVERLFLRALSRKPSPEELDDALRFLAAETSTNDASGSIALTNLAHTLFITNEFINVD